MNSAVTSAGQISLTFLGDVGPFPFKQMNYDLLPVAVRVMVAPCQLSDAQQKNPTQHLSEVETGKRVQ